MLSFEAALGPGGSPLPPHLGGALHGFVEGGVLKHAPHLAPILRPRGVDRAAHFMILPPPLESVIFESLRFGVVLYGAAAATAPALARALLAQQACGLNGRTLGIERVGGAVPGGGTRPLFERGRWFDIPEPPPVPRLPPMAPAALYRLSFRSPLLLASRKAQRQSERRADGLPWPPLASVLNSIANRLHDLEPDLAAALGLTADWSAPAAAADIAPLTPAAAPARRVAWTYTATPRAAPEPAPRRRALPFPGIVGDLIYPASGLAHESALLHWGQWLGVGQKTTMGCGHYVLSRH